MMQCRERQKGAMSGRKQVQQRWCGRANLFDHLISAGEHRRRHCEAERLSGLQIDNQFVSGWHLHRKIGRFLAFEDAIDVARGAPILVADIGSIRDQTAALGKVAPDADQRQLVLDREAGEQTAAGYRQWAPGQDHAALASTREYLKTRPDNVRRFLQAYLEGVKIASTEPEFAKQVIGKYTKTTDAADLENSYQTFLPAWERLPLVPTAAVQTMLNFATHPGAKAAKPETFIDNSILAELGKSGFVDKLYK